MSSFNISHKSSWHEDGVRMFYCHIGAINDRVIGLRTWCGRWKSRQRGGKLKAPSRVPFFNIMDFEVLGDAKMVFVDFR